MTILSNIEDRKKLEDHKQYTIATIIITIFIMLIFAGMAEAYTLDEWCDAIFQAEGGYEATYLYGIRSVNYDSEQEARRICKNTVRNTLIKYRKTRCKENDTDLQCMSSRYCPIGSDTDNGTCQYWQKNVKYFLNK